MKKLTLTVVVLVTCAVTQLGFGQVATTNAPVTKPATKESGIKNYINAGFEVTLPNMIDFKFSLYVGYEVSFNKYFSLVNTLRIGHEWPFFGTEVDTNFITYDFRTRTYLGTPYVFLDIGLAMDVLINAKYSLKGDHWEDPLVWKDITNPIELKIPISLGFAIPMKKGMKWEIIVNTYTYVYAGAYRMNNEAAPPFGFDISTGISIKM